MLCFQSSDNSDEELDSKTEPNPILLSKLGGRQEIRLKLKRGENVQGPKVSVLSFSNHKI